MEIGILIVDDEDDIRFLMRTIIDAADRGLHVVGEASTGDEAIGSFERLDPKVIVLDERMPGKTGLETATVIHARRPGQLMILCSAYLDEDMRARAKTAGIELCMSKNQVTEIAAAVNHLARPDGD